MIREALFALQNAGPGSADEHKNIARAKKYSLQVIRKFPHSIEATQAREILAQLNVIIAAPAPLARQPFGEPLKSITPNRFAATAITDKQWQDILRRFVALPGGKKKLLAWGVLLPTLLLFPFSLFAILAAATVYAFNLPILKQHLLAMLSSLESGK